MRTRKGGMADIEQLVAHGEEFWKYTPYFKSGKRYCRARIREICEALITSDAGYITVLADEEDNVAGFGLVVVTPFVFDPSYTSALELAYYIAPEHRGKYGIKLLKQMESDAREMGVTFMSMISMEDATPEAAAAVYTRLGYDKNEVVFTKEL